MRGEVGSWPPRVISLQGSASVAFGGKQTGTDRQSRPAQLRMTKLGHRPAA